MITVVICEDRSHHPRRAVLRRELAAFLAPSPDVKRVMLPHLVDLAPDGPGMQALQSADGDMIVLASLYPRATHWILDANAVRGRLGRSAFFDPEGLDVAAGPTGGNDEVPERTIWCIDLRPHGDPKPLLQEIGRIVEESTGEPLGPVESGGSSGGGGIRIDETTQFRWYPVIDCDRCQNCLECLNFCLFGVFNVDESGRLFVEQPDACRDGCPACARVCSSQAIIFPHHDSPAIAGDHKAPAATYNPGLVQLLGGLGGFGGPSPQELAAAERDRALAEQKKDELDRLVDDLDRLDL
ncbi:MAG TPA: ferredoxin family protein [Thermoguttaceae bacterium]|nr:ferredoxin family protein [Thermoguttaceae bacterium]